MKNTWTLAALGVTLLYTAVSAQEPRPSAEYKKLEVFVGKWTSQADAKPNPFGPAAQFSGTVTTELLPGGFQILSRGDSSTGFNWVEITSYDPLKRVYTISEWDSQGSVSHGTGTLTGNTFTFNRDVVRADGRSYKDRCRMTVGSPPTSVTVKCELSLDGKTWHPTIEIVSTKTG